MLILNKPKDAVIAVTYACNSRCRMCNIWRMENPQVLDLEQYKKLPVTLKDINISGGEPFLRPDLIDLLKIIVAKNPKARIIISSNGFATDLIKQKLSEILKFKPDIGLGISLDGIGQAHDAIRGIPQGYEKVLATIKMLQQDLKINNIRLAFTAGDYNIFELMKVYKLSQDLGVGFTLAAIHNSDTYFNIADNMITQFEDFKNEFAKLFRAQLCSFSPMSWARAYFSYALYKFVFTHKRELPNYSGEDNIFIDPQGNVLPSDVSPHKMGNLRDFLNYDQLVSTDQAQEAVAAEKYAQNWMICTARSAIRRNILHVIFWVIRAQIFGVKL